MSPIGSSVPARGALPRGRRAIYNYRGTHPTETNQPKKLEGTRVSPFVAIATVMAFILKVIITVYAGR